MDSTSAIESPVHNEDAPVVTTSPMQRIINRIFTRHVMSIAVLMVLPVIFTATLNPTLECMRDPDIWWHLADARQLTSTHHFMATETNSFTVGGQPWVNPEWLAELPYWFSYQALHLRGIYLVSWLMLCGNLVFMYWRGYRRSGHAGAAWWAAGLAFILISVNSGPRTIAMAYIAMSSELEILEAAERGKTRGLWLLPPLFCIWINLHGSWIIGLALLVLYILCGAFGVRKGIVEQEAFTSAERNRFLTALGLSVAALFVNPYGWRLVWNPIDMMFNQKLNIANVMEWKPLDLSTVAGIAAFGAMCLMVVCNVIQGRKWRVYELALVFFAWYAALDHMRFLFHVCSTHHADPCGRAFIQAFNLGSDEKTIPAANAFMVTAAVLVFFFIFPSQKKLDTKLGTFFPARPWRRSIQALMATFKLRPRQRHDDFRVQARVYRFGRFDIFEHRGILAAYLQAMYLVRPLEIFDQYKIDHVLVTDTMPVGYLLKHTPGWTQVERETTGKDIYVMFARTPGTPAGTTALKGVEPVKK